MTHDLSPTVQCRCARAIWRLGVASLVTAVVLVVGMAGSSETARAASTTAPIQINGAESGSSLLGIGGMSVAASSKLLFDYPHAQQTQILDDLFCSPMVHADRGYCDHRRYGAALQRLKVEIGGDSNAEIGAEPSVERERGVVDCSVGWEFKLMKAARERDPKIQIDALVWSWPGWIDPTGANDNDRVFSQDAINYLLAYLGCAKANGTPVNTLGLWNERLTPSDPQTQEWAAQLRQALDTHGFSNVQMVSDDDGDNFAGLAVCDDPQTADATAFCNAFSIASAHYPTPGSVGQEWDLQTNEFSAPGYEGTWALSNITGASASFTFTGTSIKWIGDTQFNMGMADVYLDGQLVAHDVDLYSPLDDPAGSPPQGGHYQQVLYSASGLSDGQHTIKIVVTGQANPASGGTYVNIDAFAVDGSPDGSVTSGPCSVQECVDDQSGQVQYSTAPAPAKPLLASEDAPGLYDQTDGIDWYHNPLLRGEWPGASYLAQEINTNYVGIGVSGEDIYTMLSSYYDQAQFAKGGVLAADTPWAARSKKPSFDVQSRVWTVAHTTQFTRPGTWRYVGSPFSFDDTASCYLGTPSCTDSTGETGSYVTLRSIKGSSYAIVAETKDATTSQPEQFCLSGGLSTGVVHVWETNANLGFVNVANVTTSDGCFSYTLDPDSQYTFTNERTGHAGAVTKDYTEQGMAVPYRDDFQRYGGTRTQPRYFEDQQGAFETGHACPAGGRRWCLQQVITTEPIEWEGRSEPYTVVGNQNWTDYEVQAHLTIPTTGQSASVIGRLQRSQQDFDFSERARYQAQVTYDGDGNWNWTLYRVDAGASYVTLSSGSYSNGSAWTTLALRMNGSQISLLLDGQVQATVTDATYSAGLAGLATSAQGSDPDETYDVADFDDFCVQSSGSTAGCS